ncbi:MAG: DNA-3-methyladenine glycosylase [Myxococcota bacterium]|jgi:DNA-3-methyladenine glycosylase
MQVGARLRTAFFDRPCLEVARDLVGTILVHRLPNGTRLGGRLVEVEAYLGAGRDPASHAHRGRTARNASMFGPPGRLYAYRSYGIHTCLNLVCEAEGRAAAVLLRALEPLEGQERMRRQRGLAPGASLRLLARGPGRLAQALGVPLAMDGVALSRGPLALFAAADGQAPRLARSGRTGIREAGDLPYRFYVRDSPWVSPFRAGG